MKTNAAPRLPELVDPLRVRGWTPSPQRRTSSASAGQTSPPRGKTPPPGELPLPPARAGLTGARRHQRRHSAGPLHNPRFVGHPRLERVATGNSVIGRGSRGAAVAQLQQALSDLGHHLPSSADARFGPETQRAVRAFQRQHGLSPDGLVGVHTLRALDRAAPPPGQRVERYPEYDRLLADGVLDVALAVGYDEQESHLRVMRELEVGLARRGFTRVAVENAAPAALRARGIDPEHIEAGVAYYHRRFEVEGEARQAVVRLITPRTPQAKDRFADALDQSDAVFYGGHARYGTGPDFDHIDSDQGNFVIGARGRVHRQGRARPGYNPRMNRRLRGRDNDLEARRYGEDRYQLWMFNGCTTAHYLDELRAADFGKDSANLDLMGSTRPLYWGDTGHGGLAFLDGLMSRASVAELRVDLDRINRGAGAIWDDGFADNRYRPR
jgi:hypothetical protein